MLRVSARRQSTLKRTRHNATDTPSATHSDNLAQRLAALEGCCTRFEQDLARLNRSIVALQAQLDHFFAKADEMAFRYVGQRVVDGDEP
jgi:hypothetical protein